MAYGYIQTASNIARQLKDLNKDYYGRKSWQTMYDTINRQKQASLDNLSVDYNSQVAMAYKTAYEQKSLVTNSALGTGFKQKEANDIDLALQEAFMSYKNNYLNSKQSIETKTDAAIEQIDALLYDEAQKYADYEASMYSYLQYLYNAAMPPENATYDADVNLAKMFNEDPVWSKYVITDNKDTDYETKRLMTEQELRARNYDLDSSGQGTLNKSGVDFYDQMLNAFSQEGSRYGFHSWLSKENPELYEWSTSSDVYNYTEAGTKIGTFKKMMGLKSTDDEYKFIERFGGITEEEVKTNVKEFSNDLSNIVNTGKHEDTKTLLKNYTTALGNLNNYISKLNLSEEQQMAVNEAMSKLQDNISSADVKDTSDWQAWAELVEVVKNEFDDVKREFSSGAYGNAALEVGSLVLDGVLTFGTSLVMDLGHYLFPKTSKSLTDAFGRDVYKDRSTKRITSNKELIENIEQQYLDLITLLTSYAK